MDAAEKALPKGTELDGGSIIIGEKIGKGGFGITYTAYDRKRRRNFVLKEFFPDHMVTRQADHSLRVSPEHRGSYEKSLRSFIREARVLNELKHHPNIVRVFFFLEENNTAYYGMEQLQGKDLRRYAEETKKKTGKPMDPQHAFDLLKPIINALEYSHSHRVLHRDVSPDNIFMSEVRDEAGNVQMVPKLIDYGAAYVAIENFTQTCPNVRKNGYSPFEQTMPPEYQGTWGDVYSLAATYYALIVGHAPKSAIDRYNTPSKEVASPLSQGAPISEAVNAVIMRALAFHYRERTQTISEFARNLEFALKGKRSTQDEQARSQRMQPVQPPKSLQADEDSFVSDEMNEWPDSEISAPEPEVHKGISGRRVAAYMIDLMLFGLLGAALQVVLNHMFNFSKGDVVFVLFACLWVFLLMFGFGTVLTVLSTQATLGMLLCNLHLRSTDHGDAALASCITYNLVRSVPVLGLAIEMIPSNGKTMIEVISGLRVLEVGANAATKSEFVSGVAGHSDVSFSAAADDVSVVISKGHTGRVPSQQERKPAPPPAGGVLLCVKGDLKGQSFAIFNGICVGRSMVPPNIPIPRQDVVVSSKHCVFRQEGKQWYLVDCSTNGTTVNDKRILKTQSSPLKSGSKVLIGNQHFVFTRKEERV